jgi:phage replication-related protein YjqB (UPF0714/DUF867 family)
MRSARAPSSRDVAELRNFADLAARFRRGSDYDLVVQARPASKVAVVVPHGGGIERGSSAIGRAIAGDDLNLYLFEGMLPARNYEELHLTSHRFDEPACLALIAHCDHVVTVHGFNAQAGVEPDPGVVIGGLDERLKDAITVALRAAGVAVQTDGLRFQARDPDNICNRGNRRMGVQLELSGRLRGGPQQGAFVAAMGAVLRRLPS